MLRLACVARQSMLVTTHAAVAEVRDQIVRQDISIDGMHCVRADGAWGCLLDMATAVRNCVRLLGLRWSCLGWRPRIPHLSRLRQVGLRSIRLT